MMRITDLRTHPEPHVTPRELAEYYHVSVKVVYRDIGKGALPAVRVSGSLRIRVVDAQRYGRPVDTQIF